jgi:acyl carrier protein
MENKDQIELIIIKCVTDYLETIGNNETLVTSSTNLIGSDAILDSIGLVNVIVDIEGELAMNDINVTLTSEKAMSRKVSPFRSVGSIVAFINECINEH